MKKSNTYIFLYASVMVVIVATVLSLVSTWLGPFQERNIEVAKKTDILKSVEKAERVREVDDRHSYIYEEYEKYIVETYVINHKGEIQDDIEAFDVDMRDEMRKPLEERNLPVFVSLINDDSYKYIIPMHGRGLWGPVFGYVALNDDFNTIYGIILDHESETPGLGAEISTSGFQERFKGKRLFDEDSEFISVKILAPSDSPVEGHSVDGISGGTMTTNGVEDMMYDVLSSYEDYFRERRKEQ